MKAPFNCYAIYVKDGPRWILLAIIAANERISFGLKELVKDGLAMAQQTDARTFTHNKGDEIDLTLNDL